jgi:hypothetical protein
VWLQVRGVSSDVLYDDVTYAHDDVTSFKRVWQTRVAAGARRFLKCFDSHGATTRGAQVCHTYDDVTYAHDDVTYAHDDVTSLHI